MEVAFQGQLLTTLLECGICLSLLCEPISLSCGHTFCRLCLVKSLRQHKKQCPGCREICHVSAENAAENIVIKSLAVALEPELYKQRLSEGEKEKETWTNVYPVFFYNKVELPYNKLSFHLFEPRYKTMMNRVVNSNRAFAYVCTNSLTAGDVALVAVVKEAEFLSDGRCIVEANLCKRSRVVEHYVEDGTQGLHYCRLEPLPDDVVVTPDDVDSLNVLKGRAVTLVEDLLADDYVRRVVDEQFGAMPSSADTPEAFSFWLACVSPLSDRDKAGVLHSRNTRERMQVCIDRLEAYLEQRRNPRSFPIVSALGSSLASTISALLGTPGRLAATSFGVSQPATATTGTTSEAIGQGRSTGAALGDGGSTGGESDDDSVPSLVSVSADSSDMEMESASEGRTVGDNSNEPFED